METTGRYALIGAFAIAGFLGLVGFLLWLTQMDLARETRLYAIDFQSVSGLSVASDVRFAGLVVGKVELIGLSQDNPGFIRVTVEIDANTPLRSDSVATIEAQGVTGVSHVGISAGSPEALPIWETSDRDVPVIQAGRSYMQSITEAAPELLAETLDLMRDLRRLTGGESQERIGRILENVEGASEDFSDALDDFSRVSETVAAFAAEIGEFNASLDVLTVDASGAIRAAEDAFSAIEVAAIDVATLSGEARVSLQSAASTVDTVGQDISVAAKGLSTLSDRAQTFLGTADGNVTNLTARAQDTLVRGGKSLNELDQTLAALRELVEPGKSAIGAAERAFDEAGRSIGEGLPDLIDQLGSTARTLDGAVTRIAEDLPQVTSAIGAASSSAETAFVGMESVVRSTAPAIRRFVEEGLPQYSRLAAEMRTAVKNLEGLVDQLRRDPSRFFLEPRTPEYRR